MTNRRNGQAEFETAHEFMFAAHELIHSVYSRKGDAPRSLVNLAFLALEVTMKSHLKGLTGAFPKTHELGELHDALMKHPDGAKRVEKIAKGYAEVMKTFKGTIPAVNTDFDSLDKIIAFLTKKAFLQWRYVFEAIEGQVLAGTGVEVTFPFFNLYFVTWCFLGAAAEALNDRSLPDLLDYARMPYYFTVTRSEPGSDELVWKTYVTRFAVGNVKKA